MEKKADVNEFCHIDEESGVKVYSYFYGNHGDSAMYVTDDPNNLQKLYENFKKGVLKHCVYKIHFNIKKLTNFTDEYRKDELTLFDVNICKIPEKYWENVYWFQTTIITEHGVKKYKEEFHSLQYLDGGHYLA